MDVCHDCKCFHCEYLCAPKCPLGHVCYTCYKGANSRSFKITHCDRQEQYVPRHSTAAVKESVRKKPPIKLYARRRKRNGQT